MRIGIFVAAWLMLASAAPALAQRAQLKVDHYGDPLPPGAVVRLGTKRLQTKGGFGWTPDGKSLVTFRGGTIYFWDLSDGHCHETLLTSILSDPFYSYRTRLVLSPDAQRLVCTNLDGAITTWNRTTVETASAPPVEGNRREENAAVALHPSGKQFVTLRHSGELQVRDFATCQIVRTLVLPEIGWASDTPAPAFSPDGKTLAIGSQRSQSIFLVDFDKGGEPVVIKRAHGQFLRSLNFLADGQLYSIGTKPSPGAERFDETQSKNEVRIWDLGQRPPVSREWPLDESLPTGCNVAFSADGRTLAAVFNDRLVICDGTTGKIQRTIGGIRIRNGHRANIQIDPQGRRVAVDDWENYVRVWDIATGAPVLSTGQHHQGGIYAADWSPDGSRIATGGFTGDVCVWDAASGKPLAVFFGPTWGVFSLLYSADGQQLCLCGDEPNRPMVPGKPQASGPVQWRNATSGKLLREHVLSVRARLLVPSPDNRLLAVATEALGDFAAESEVSVHLLDVDSGEERGRFSPGGNSIVALSWSADGQELLVGNRTQVTRTSASTLKTVGEVKLPHFRKDRHSGLLLGSDFYRAAFSRRGDTIVTAGGLPEIYGWKLPAGEKLWTIKLESPSIHALAVSPDQSLLACLTPDDKQNLTLRLFDIEARREVAKFDLGRERADRIFFSPSGRQVLVGFADGTGLVYNASDL